MENEVGNIFAGLNPVQKQAVETVEGPVLIVAGAGSGKTRVLTCRIANILAQGCDPEKVLSLTFTNKAAKEMKERIANMVGARKARRLYMGTFHSVFIRILRKYASEIGYKPEFTIYDTDDSIRLLKTCIKELGLDDKVYKPKDVLSRISYAKNNLATAKAYRLSPNALEQDRRRKTPRICDIYELYAQKCIQSAVMDFDDVLLNMNILLKRSPKAFEEIEGMFRYILVDEYQDTNMAQYLILKQLSKNHRNICVVGDDSQSIYAFRGAKVENILNFQKDYPGCKIFRLEQNYRSTQTIVNAANSLIAKNSRRIPKECFSRGDEGEKIRLIKAYTETEEAMLIVSSIMGTLRSESAQYQDFAILYRTNAQSRALEEALRRRNIPYKIYSGNSFYERAEVKDAMAYLKLTVNIDDDESFKRIVNKPARGIGDTSIAALAAAAHNHSTTLFRAAYADDLETYGLKAAAQAKIRSFCDFVQKMAVRATREDAFTVVDSVLKESGLWAALKADMSVEGQSRAANVEELLNAVRLFIEERHADYAEDMIAEEKIYAQDDLSPEDYPLVTLSDFTENITLISAADVSDEEAANRVALMTVHTSKGLEFPYVYIAGMEENLFPSCGFGSSESDLEEERRLFYVAMTRAKKEVSLSFSSSRMRNGKSESNPPSRFVSEIDRAYILNPIDPAEEEEFGQETQGWGGWKSGGKSSWGNSQWGGGSGSRSGVPAGQSSWGAKKSSSSAGGAKNSYLNSYGKSSPVQTIPSGARQQGTSQTASGFSRPLGSTQSASKTTFVRHSGPVPPVKDDPNFVPSPMSAFRPGQRVEHNRFGKGTIKSLEGRIPDLKAVVQFDSLGEKLLMLKYAKMRVAEAD